MADVEGTATTNDITIDLAGVLEALPDGVVVIDAMANILWVNAKFRALTGWASDEVVGRNGLELLDPEQLADALEALNITTTDETSPLPPGAYRLANRDGEFVTFELHAEPIDRSDPDSVIAMMVRPIEYQFLMNDGIELLNAGGPIEDMADYVVNRIGWAPGPVSVVFDDDAGDERTAISDGLPDLLTGAVNPADGEAPWQAAIRTGDAVHVATPDLPPSVRAAAEAAGFVACTAEVVPDPGGQDAVIVLWFSEGSSTTYRFLFREEPRYLLLRLALERRHYLRALRTAATKDHLTGLANRAHFFETIERASPDQRYAVLYIDLDDFKPINDTHGHFIGDAVLTEIGRRIRSSVRATDLPARLGGDEFAVLCLDAVGEDAVDALAERLHTSISRPMAMPGESVRVGASIGVAIAAKPGVSPSHLLEVADRTLYEMKRLGKDGWKTELVT